MEAVTTDEGNFTGITDLPLLETSLGEELYDSIIIHYVIFSFAIAASFITCITSVKSNKIDKCCRNIIMVHWSFFEIIHLLVHVSSMIHKDPSGECSKVHCMLQETEGILSCSSFLFFVLLIMDSLALRYNSLVTKFKDSYKLLIGVIYVITGVCFLIFSQFCGDCIYHNLPQNIVYAYFIFLIVVIVFNIFLLPKESISQYNDAYPNLNLAVIDIALFMCLPSSVWHLVSTHMKLKISVVEHITIIIKISNQIVILAILLIIDRNFRTALKQIVKCQCRRRQYIINVKKNDLKL